MLMFSSPVHKLAILLSRNVAYHSTKQILQFRFREGRGAKDKGKGENAKGE